MSTINGPTYICDLTNGGHERLTGKLAAGLAITNDNIYRERLRLPPYAVSVDVRFKMTVSGGTPTVQVVPQTANIMGDDKTVSSVTTGLTTATNLSSGTEALHSYTLKGERFADVVLDATGASAAGTLTYCDVSVKLQ